MGGNDFKTQSSVPAQFEPVAGAMFEIFKSGLASGLPRFPGSQTSAAFNPGAVQQTFNANVRQPLTSLFESSFAPLVGPAGQQLAQDRFGETIAGLSGQAGRVGEQQAYQEFLRTQPAGQPLNLGQALLGGNFTASYFPESQSDIFAQAGLTGLNALGTGLALSGFDPTPNIDTSNVEFQPLPGQPLGNRAIRNTGQFSPFSF